MKVADRDREKKGGGGIKDKKTTKRRKFSVAPEGNNSPAPLHNKINMSRLCSKGPEV